LGYALNIVHENSDRTAQYEWGRDGERKHHEKVRHNQMDKGDGMLFD